MQAAGQSYTVVFCNKDRGEGEWRDQNVGILVREINDGLCSFTDV